VPFVVRPARVDESLAPEERGAAAAERLARAKALAVAGGETLPVLAADTLVICNGSVLGKPRDAAQAARMLRQLSGRDHEVVTGVCLVAGGVARSGVESTTVTFAALSDEQIADYVASGEPLDKAGAYHVDGRGAAFIASVAGSPSNVAGLPVRLVARLAAEAGVALGMP
jgi:septum formation protein